MVDVGGQPVLTYILVHKPSEIRWNSLQQLIQNLLYIHVAPLISVHMASVLGW